MRQGALNVVFAQARRPSDHRRWARCRRHRSADRAVRRATLSEARTFEHSKTREANDEACSARRSSRSAFSCSRSSAPSPALVAPASAQARRRCCPTSPSSTRSRGRPSCRSTSRSACGADRACPSSPRTIRSTSSSAASARRRAAARSASSRRRARARASSSRADGYIVTNAHVVDSADEVRIRLTDRREFIAKVVGTDKRTDVAVVKIEATNLPRVVIGDPEKLKVGEWVVAIGKPFGLENTMTAGHRQREGARPAAGEPGPVHPDRRRDQPRQLGRPAVQPARRGRRHQLADLFALRRLHGPRVRDPDRRRDEHRQPDPREGPRHARPHRRADPGSDEGGGGLVRPEDGDGRARELGREGRAGGEGRRRARRHHHQGRRPRRDEQQRAAAHRDAGRAGQEGRADRLARRAVARDRASSSPR